ncbi:hypothetical protein RSAG8_10914, partial [Rhizoctonia solani AG-8 WAC10335]
MFRSLSQTWRPASICPELITLHESGDAYNANPARGVRLYMKCVQLKIVSNGFTKIPAGIGFQTSYTYSDKVMVYDLYKGNPKTYIAPRGELSSIAVTGQAGIGPVTTGGSKPDFLSALVCVFLVSF